MPLSIDDAIEVFVHAFSLTRSFTHPYVARRIESAWVMRDERARARDPRNEEWIAAGVSPAEVDRLARQHARGKFSIGHLRRVDESDVPLRTDYRRLGYRLRATEPLFAHELKTIPEASTSMRIERVRDQALADRLAKAARSRQILPEHLAAGDASPVRQYVALDPASDAIVGSVRSIVAGRATWVSNTYVAPEQRRKGIGRAMLARLLADDRAAGSVASVLLSSHAGAKLYPQLGYATLGELMLYSRKK